MITTEVSNIYKNLKRSRCTYLGVKVAFTHTQADTRNAKGAYDDAAPCYGLVEDTNSKRGKWRPAK
jgi:hypothetical protein